MPDLITSDAEDSQILYVVPGSTAFVLLAASFVADGGGLNADFVPMIQILAPDQRELFVFGRNLRARSHALDLPGARYNVVLPVEHAGVGVRGQLHDPLFRGGAERVWA
jgi:hypothetical protein